MSEADREYPRLFPKPEQTIAGIGRAIRECQVTCADVLNRCLEQVDLWEPKVHAWVVLDRDGALEQARRLDDELKAGNDRGPLHGIPIGIKDVFDVKGMPTACGARRWADRVAQKDAEVVARLRTAGAVIMGKTVTTAYAFLDPPVTRNPWNLERTPGGSSSGSAAAVACGMCYGAIGTQTGGSITRPASFCGICGMKPTWPAMTHLGDGLLPLARSLDHVGPIARTVDDLRWLFLAMSNTHRSRSKERTEQVDHEIHPDILRFPAQSLAGMESDRIPRHSPPRFIRLRGFFDRRIETSARVIFDAAVRFLATNGAEIVDLDDPIDFEQVLENYGQVVAAEAASVHSDWLNEFSEDYPPRIRSLILQGRFVSSPEYLKAKEAMTVARQAITSVLYEALITPATVGTPPGLATTGDPAFNSPWSYTHLPTVSFPIGVATDGLPVAVQLVGSWMLDHELLEWADWCERVIRTWRQ